jgi:hypothetical protein
MKSESYTRPRSFAWTLGARFVPVVESTDGNAFDARVDDAVQTIYDSGDRNAVVFSHGATIMFWTMMNVDNPELGLILSHPVDNTSGVVVTGNPEDGWTLENWDGVEVSADPSLPTKLFVDGRNVVTAPQTAAFRIRQAFVPKVVNDVRGSAAVQSDEQAPSTQTALNAAINKRSLRSVKGSADEPAAEAPKTTRLAKKTEKPNGAMNLTRVETSFTRAMPLPQAATRPGRTNPRVGRPTTTRATAPTRRPPDAAHWGAGVTPRRPGPAVAPWRVAR